MDVMTIFMKLGISLGLGLLVGLQRERVDKPLAGIRTFALFTLLGSLCALLSVEFGGWVLAAGLAGVVLVLYAGNMAGLQTGKARAGVTTEAAVLLMFAVGAYLVIGQAPVAIAVGGAVALLLHFKEPLHTLVHRMGEADIKAIMQFVLITLVILPVLPNQSYGLGEMIVGGVTYGPYRVLNPFKIWLLVVLIVGISLAGYVAHKFVGARAGALLGGLLAGLISSTATTVSYARLSRRNSDFSGSAALAIVVASVVVFGRVLVLVAVTAPGSIGVIAPPILAMMGAMAVIALGLFVFVGRSPVQAVEQANPSQLTSALVFGALFAAVLLAAAVAQDVLGSGGLYAVAAISGLTDMDAITLSTAQMTTHEGRALSPQTAWRVIMAASLANLVFKTGVVAVMGQRRLLGWVGAAFAAALVAGVVILAAWPGAR